MIETGKDLQIFNVKSTYNTLFNDDLGEEEDVHEIFWKTKALISTQILVLMLLRIYSGQKR